MQFTIERNVTKSVNHDLLFSDLLEGEGYALVQCDDYQDEKKSKRAWWNEHYVELICDGFNSDDVDVQAVDCKRLAQLLF